MSTGSCLCGAIRFELDDARIAASVGCYCANCRKVSGSQYGVYLQVRSNGFHWLSGQENVAAYESSPGNKRGFCKTCGAVAPIATNYGAIRVPAGALDADPGVKPSAILFSASKAEWCSLDSASETFVDAGPQSFWRNIVVRLFS